MSGRAATLAPFRVTGRLPQGTTLLEASAGTGKTYTIAALVTRWVAEAGLPLPRMLVVTFTRAATAELRDRVRRRLVGAADHLEATAVGLPASRGDELLRHLAAADADEIARRHARLTRAVTDIDAATISTIHGFCQHVLDGLGLASDLDRDAELVENTFELIEEVVDDLLVDTYLGDSGLPRLGRAELVTLGRAVVANPTTRMVPRGSDDDTAALRLHLAQRIRDEVARRSRRRRQLSYDELLTRLDSTLRDPDRGAAACAALRQRYRVVLIDEFQDTDPVQWSIVARAFGAHAQQAVGDQATDDQATDDQAGGRCLVLIGDPKQAIYSFRGGDVNAYLSAGASAGHHRGLGVNWRSDAGLLRAFDALFDGAAFGDDAIAYRTVAAAPGHDAPRLVGAPGTAPLRLRLLPRHDSFDLWKDAIRADQARAVIAADVAADIVRLLSAEPEVVHRDRDGEEAGRAPLRARDVAVLVRSNAEAGLVQDALHDVGVPAVINGVESVFATAAATAWQRLLDALEHPASTTRVRALALSPWVGWSGDRVAAAGDDDWDRLHDDVVGWARLLRDHGVAAVQRAVLLRRGARPRLLRHRGGERLLTDLEHVGELVHAAATAEHLGTAALAGWLRERIEDADEDQQDERLRRLETDDEAVQILTIHRSKGLEFAVVLCPFLWSSVTEVRGIPIFHGPDRSRRIDVGGKGHESFADHKARAEDEARGEELRLLYVALTRARHRVVAWYAPAGNHEWSGLGRLLLCRTGDGGADTVRGAPLPTDEEAAAAAAAVAARSEGTITVETVPEQPPDAGWQQAPSAPARLETATFRRAVDTAWRRTSYSALTRLDAPSPRVATEPDEPITDDEALAADRAPDDRDPTPDPHGLRAVALPLSALPGGTDVGTFVHRVLEHTDFAADDLDAELRRVVAHEQDRRRLDIDDATVATGLRAAVETPLGPMAGGIRLRDVTRRDRRDEVEFELPLDRRDGARSATVADLAGLLREHLDGHDPLARYPDALPAALLRRDLRGYLAGSLDMILRRPGPDGNPVFHVVDHKSNRLAPHDEALTAWHYRPDALADAMVRGDYPLQALLYTVALHRILRWRLDGYDPATHLGSVLYLFVRGMAGPATPAPGGSPCGVFAWRLPAALVTAASDLLHGADGP